MLLGVVATLSIDLAMIGCSSDKPPAGSGTTGTDAALSPIDATSSRDGGKDADGSSDATDEEFVFTGCLDDKPAPDAGVDSGVDASAPPVCPTSGDCSAVCDHIVDHYKLGVAQVAVSCLLKLPSCASKFDVFVCVDSATGIACKDPTSKAFCTPLVTACDPNAGGPGSNIDEGGCELVASSLSSSGRSALASCIQSKTDAGTCPADVLVCTDDIRQ